MIRLGLLARGPILMSIFPFSRQTDPYDKPVNTIITPLEDELGWDRLKRIFHTDQEGQISKELQSIMNVTISGLVIGTALGGMKATKTTVDNFVSNNEATRYFNHLDAKRALQHTVFVNFLRKGGRMGGKLALFCFLFSSITTCTTAYRGKIAVENYIFGGSITGFVLKMNLGLRGALVGTGLGGVLGGVCGGLSVLILKLSGVTIDEVLDAQKQWITTRNENMREKIKEHMTTELTEVKQAYEENKKFRLMQQKKNVEDHDT